MKKLYKLNILFLFIFSKTCLSAVRNHVVSDTFHPSSPASSSFINRIQSSNIFNKVLNTVLDRKSNDKKENNSLKNDNNSNKKFENEKLLKENLSSSLLRATKENLVKSTVEIGKIALTPVGYTPGIALGLATIGLTVGVITTGVVIVGSAKISIGTLVQLKKAAVLLKNKVNKIYNNLRLAREDKLKIIDTLVDVSKNDLVKESKYNESNLSNRIINSTKDELKTDQYKNLFNKKNVILKNDALKNLIKSLFEKNIQNQRWTSN